MGHSVEGGEAVSFMEWKSRDDEDHFVYIMAKLNCHGELVPPCKVGISKHPRIRRRQIQKEESSLVVLVATYCFWKRSHAASVEKEFHNVCSGQRVYGEWFDIYPSDAVGLMKQCLDNFIVNRLCAQNYEEYVDCADHIGVPGRDWLVSGASFFEAGR
ncbi:GIY-YIG nuclease family protein [Zhengella sp. ZM62]|uniref:GIY-YIG nuclease family protein n=1 Tax=Zhengella sedimenti TaxID=3390035 RepID=UPI003976DE7A